jgi:hypothetical protein
MGQDRSDRTIAQEDCGEPGRRRRICCASSKSKLSPAGSWLLRWRRLWRCYTDRDCSRDWNEMAELKERGVVVTGRERRRVPSGQACSEPALRPAWTARAIARLDRRWIAGLADRDREDLRAGGPGHGRMILAAGERDLEERQAAGHADGLPGVILDHHAS